MLDKVRVGVIGMGMMGDAHARVISALPSARLIACVETDESKKADLEKRFMVPVFTGTEAMYREGVDAVFICTPDDMHTSFILEAFEKGVKVFVEKPLSISYSECMEIIKARPSPKHLMVGHVLRFDPRLVSAKKLIDDGKLGELLLVNIRRSNSTFNAERIGPRCSIVWFLGIHDIDAVHWLTGQKVKKIVGVNGFKRYSPNWDYVGAHMVLENGAALTMENHWLLPRTRINQLDAGIAIIGEKGMLDISLESINMCFTPAEGGGTRFYDSFHQPEDINGVPGGDLRLEDEAFISAVLNDTDMPISGEEAAEAVKVIPYL